MYVTIPFLYLCGCVSCNTQNKKRKIGDLPIISTYAEPCTYPVITCNTCNVLCTSYTPRVLLFCFLNTQSPDTQWKGIHYTATQRGTPSVHDVYTFYYSRVANRHMVPFQLLYNVCGNKTNPIRKINYNKYMSRL
jgi:hypothetical protein